MLEAFIQRIFGGKKEEQQHIKMPEYPLKNDIVCDKFRIKGKYPGTGRMWTVEIVAWEDEPEDRLIKKAGLTNPYEITRIGLDQPTERQITYAKSLGIFIPHDAAKNDVSILIDRAINHEPICQEKAPTEILDILIKQMGIYIPSYAGEKEMERWFQISMKSDTEKYAYFAMKVYAQSTGKNYHFIQDANPAEQKRFYDFAREYKDNRSFVESYERYDPSEITIMGKIKRKLKAYELANAFFYENL